MSVLTFLQENSFFWLLSSWAIISYLLWDTYRRNFAGKNSFDITIIGSLLILFLHRISHIFVFAKEYRSNYWSWNPIAWVNGEKMFFGSKPWVIFSFWYKGFDFRILLICGLLIIFIISKLQQISFWKIINSLANTFFIYSPVFFVLSYFQNLIIGYNTDKFYGVPFWGTEGMRHPVQIYLLIIWFTVLLIWIWLNRKYKLLENVGGLIQLAILLVCSSFVLQFFAYNISPFVIDWLRIVSALSVLFGIISIFFERANIKEDAPKAPNTINRFTPFNSSNLNKNQNRWTKKR